MRRQPMPGLAWLQVVCAPLFMAMAAAFCTGLALLHGVARAVRQSQVQRVHVEAAHAHALAETGLLQAFATRQAHVTQASGPLACVVEQQPEGWLARVHSPEGQWGYRSQRLLGAGPAALDVAAVSDRDGVVAGTAALDAAELARAERGDRSCALERDPGIALARWRCGTDRDDYVLGAGQSFMSFASVPELVVVPGHVWLPPASTPLQLQVERDTVIVAMGNLYLGRSVRVHGAGRLVLVAALPAHDSAFVDRDRDGRWSSGDRLLTAAPFRGAVEGGGRVYVFSGPAGARLELGCGLVVPGSCVVSVDAHVSGPLVVEGEVVRGASNLVLQGRREFAFRVDRERVPGFAVQGAPRPSLLVPLPKPARDVAVDGEQPLYLAQPSR